MYIHIWIQVIFKMFPRNEYKLQNFYTWLHNETFQMHWVFDSVEDLSLRLGIQTKVQNDNWIIPNWLNMSLSEAPLSLTTDMWRLSS